MISEFKSPYDVGNEYRLSVLRAQKILHQTMLDFCKAETEKFKIPREQGALTLPILANAFTEAMAIAMVNLEYDSDSDDLKEMFDEMLALMRITAGPIFEWGCKERAKRSR